jgi:hypothetical protein
LSTVEVNNFDTAKVTIIDTAIKQSNIVADSALLLQKNIEIIAISKGNLPLQGVNEFVMIATKRSRGESIIRQPVTPTALQP